jgi:hypothetical protein
VLSDFVCRDVTDGFPSRYNYDLGVPHDTPFQPRPSDGEVESFDVRMCLYLSTTPNDPI